VHVRRYVIVPVAVGVSGADWDGGTVPDHPLLAVQDVAFVELHVNMVCCPRVIVPGFALIVTVGAGVVGWPIVNGMSVVLGPPTEFTCKTKM
jgi:hypothetical protein